MILKDVTVPDGALYGVETVRCLQNLTCSPFKMASCPELIEALACVKKAAARANFSCGVIDAPSADAIDLACDDVIAHRYDEQFPVDMLHGGGSIAFNQNMNEVLATVSSRLGGISVEAKKHVNASQSTADSCSTAFRLALLTAAAKLDLALSECVSTLKSKCDAYDAVVTVARTCLQDAMIVSVASYFSGWQSALERRRKRVAQAADQLHNVNLGGTVIGDGAGARPEYRTKVVSMLSEVTGRKLTLRENLFDAAQNSDDIGELSAALSQLVEFLVKMCSDLRLLSSGPRFGFSEISLPAVQNGSSFFSNKNNPVVPETLLQACFHVMGNHRAAQAAVEHAELSLNVFESGAFFHVLQSLKILEAAMVLFNDKCLRELSVNETRCAEMVTQFNRQ